MTARDPPRLLASADALRLAATGGPCVLVAAGVAGAEALAAATGIAAWCVAAGPGPDAPLRLHRPGADPAEATLPLPALPAGVLGVVAPDAATAAPILAAQGGADGIGTELASDAMASLPGIARWMAAALGRSMAEAARLQHALVTLREEAEEIRTAMAGLVQGVGHMPPPPPVLALAAEPASAEPSVIAVPLGGEAPFALAQRLGTTLEGAAAVALCLAEAALAGRAAALRVRLIGAESGRAVAAWTIPGAALAPGWLMLDLPTPLRPLRETACLDLTAEGLGPEDRLAFALEDRVAPPDRAAVDGTGRIATPDRPAALAFRLWIAPFGRRFALSPWWDWEGQDAPPLGVPVRPPEQAWEAARIASGDLVALGEGGPVRPVLVLPPGEGAEARAVLPAIPVAGLDLIEAEIAVRLGDATGLEAALWLQPEADGEALSLAAPGARCTGWRPVDAARGGLVLPLRPAPGGPASLAVVLVLRRQGIAGVAAVRVEWTDLLGRALSPPLPPPDPASPASRGLRPSPALAAAAPADAVPALDSVRLHEFYAMEGGGYRHLDIGIAGLRLGALAWPRARFKFALDAEAPRIEVRARPDWPVVFERWPGEQADEHGPYFILTEADAGGRALERLWSARDRRLLSTLLRLLPMVVATAARAATTNAAEYEAWVAQARRFAAALLGAPEGGGTR